jgi:uncharacterized membrane protein (DUF373 family)
MKEQSRMVPEERSTGSRELPVHRSAALSRTLSLLELSEHVVYTIVGIIFLLAAITMLVHSVAAFPTQFVHEGAPIAVVNTVNDLLLVVIIMEVLRTVLSYLQGPRVSLRPFLFVAAISATRQILSIGAHMSVAGESIVPERFQQLMIDLVANAVTILAIAIALYLIARSEQWARIAGSNSDSR